MKRILGILAGMLAASRGALSGYNMAMTISPSEPSGDAPRSRGGRRGAFIRASKKRKAKRKSSTKNRH